MEEVSIFATRKSNRLRYRIELHSKAPYPSCTVYQPYHTVLQYRAVPVVLSERAIRLKIAENIEVVRVSDV